MTHPFLELCEKKIVVLDGAMGTNLQKQFLTPADFGGKDGCNEYLVITKPEAVRKIHEDFFAAGCDAVETNSFGSNRIVLAEYGLENRAFELNEKAAKLAREAAQKFSSSASPRFVLGSIGPGTKLPSLGHIGFDELKEAAREQIRGLLAGGVDGLIIETCQDLLQIKIAVIAAEECFAEARRRVPLITQVTVEPGGTLLLGSELGAAITMLEMFPIDVIGMNCATGPAEMVEHVRTLCKNSNRLVSILPNAGLPENIGGVAHYNLAPGEFADYQERFVKEFGVSIVGGCCGTTPEHLAAVAARVKGYVPKPRKVKSEPACASLYSSVTYRQDPRPLLVGEQTNANGSRRFKKILEADDYEGLLEIGREAVREGAHIVDLCVAFAGRDEKKDMAEVVSRFNQHVTAPLMIDSTEPPVLEEALKRISGKPIINSINLEDGEEKLARICGLAKKYGAALVALVIDEKGMARTREEKLSVAKRIHDLAVGKHGIRPADLFFDALTFTVGAGDEASRNAAVETLEAIKLIKRELAPAQTILGVSNVSFGLAAHARKILNSVFLHECVNAGLDAAIVHADRILPVCKIAPDDLEVSERLIFNDRKDGKDPLEVFIRHFEARGPVQVKKETEAPATIEEVLRQKILNGEKDGLEASLDEALKKYKPFEIINQFLLGGMKTVGELFGAGKMQLPFVLRSAEIMKRAVAYLERFMDRKEGSERGRIVLATVKGDVHDIGKNLVDIILSNNGYKVINLGIKQPIDSVLKAASEHRADAVGLSGLLVKSTHVMKEDLEEMNRRGIAIPVLLGGAALTEKYVNEDLARNYKGKVYYGRDAFSALKIMDEIKKTRETSGAGAEESAKDSPASRKSSRSKGKSFEGADRLIQEEEMIRRYEENRKKRPNFVRRDNVIPRPPFVGYRILKNIRLQDVFPWVNKKSLYSVQWQFRQGERTERMFDLFLQENVEPLFEKFTQQCIREKILEPKAVYGFFPCYSEGDDLIVLNESGKVERTRFHFPRQRREPYQCIADFFRPKSSGLLDVVALAVVTMGGRIREIEEKAFKGHRYQEYLYLHGLSVESAEALAEYLHAMIRRDLRIHHQDKKTKWEIFRKGYQGSRYSFGYPACPHLEDQKKLFDLLPADKIGVKLTETFQMVPEQSTSAVIVHHPQAKYFSV
ncbi:MAG: Methionine synthase [Candidatus Omnitrophica bacterium ADurb.Bin277]|nr:MAG: Methionine synthase [Candidatus Omnitrophica bacterium ADurb.Bin277]